MENVDFILYINKKSITGFIGVGSILRIGNNLIGCVLHARDSDDGEQRVVRVMIDKDIQVSRPA